MADGDGDGGCFAEPPAPVHGGRRVTTSAAFPRSGGIVRGCVEAGRPGGWPWRRGPTLGHARAIGGATAVCYGGLQAARRALRGRSAVAASGRSGRLGPCVGHPC